MLNTFENCLGQNHPKGRELLKLEAASLANYKPLKIVKGKENRKDGQSSA